MSLPTLTAAEDLLSLLQAAPAHRLVEFLIHEEVEGPAVLDIDAQGQARVVALIAEGSAAGALLDEAYEVALPTRHQDPAAQARWEQLPLCYGPYCSTWVLHAHPLAPTSATDNDARGDLYLGWAEVA